MSITQATSFAEIAALVSQAPQRAGIDAVLGGGGAATQYSDNEYMTTDLDFVGHVIEILSPDRAD